MFKEQAVKNFKNVKLVLGNGFDLFCGLKTKYCDFFESNRSLFDNLNQWILEYKKNENYLSYLDSTIGNWNNFKSKIKLDDKITIWDLFFLLSSPVVDESINWCNIEEEIKNSLLGESIFSWKNVLKILLLKTRPRKDNYHINEFLCACYICQYIQQEITEVNFYNFLLKELKKFEKRFGEYINLQMLENNYSFQACKAVNKIIIAKKGNIKSIDTFNYSSFTIENITTYNVNGTTKNPIFGIDSSQIKTDNYCYAFTKTKRRYMLKINKNEFRNDYQYDNVIIFGHSLNEQDYNYFFPLFDKLRIMDSSSTGVIVFAYYIYDQKQKEKIKNDLVDNVLKLFEKYEDYYSLRKENRLNDILDFNNKIIFCPIYQ